MISLACRYGIFKIWCKEPALLCNRACCSSEVAKEMFISLLITMNHSAGKVGMCLNMSPLKKSYDQPRQHIEKQRHRFANKGPSSQGYGLPVVTYGCESWTVKQTEHRRTDAFEMWCWRRLLRIPWTARRFNLSILKEISP